MNQSDTIVAPASGAGRAAVAVIRVSGPGTTDVLKALCGALPTPRHATLRKLHDPRAGALLDRGLVLWFPAPSSFTGEDMAELQVHGSRAVTGAVIEAALAVEGTRLAEPGEFARRAFENGKIDLTEVEGLADLVNAETEAQRRQALAQAEGSLRRLYQGWRAELLKAQALMEAGLDFSDEGDVVADVQTKAEMIVRELRAEIATQLADRRGERLRDGYRVVIAGPPNAGKSSLLNALARRDAAIVSEEAGTTRDVIEVHLDLAGVPVILIDTAGLRATEGAVEAEGVRRALARAGEADLVLWLVDATDPKWSPPEGFQGFHAIANADGVVSGQKTSIPVLFAVLNKRDLAPDLKLQEGLIAVSAKTGEGLEDLVKVLENRVISTSSWDAGAPPLTRVRHRQELQGAHAALARFLDKSLIPELKADELRVAARHLGRLTGHIDVEEVLGALFAEFCIGK
ncbi:MAG: tRNA uridine-5-carboxymethylaminomethyl(34) synthesis GTPase MnmE [Alphaproteobacteria bacterium]|nr:tRNA uridine-5-carboxymethylaminomethyl(34) synthesis GTPase MnmE [Alphaproteobacteria bacterium]